MTMRTGLYIDGEWLDTEARVSVVDPATGDVLAQVSAAGTAECDAAVDAAARAAGPWARTPGRARAEILRKAYELMVAEADALARLITLENGKVLSDARTEVIYAAEFFRWFSEEAVRIAGDYRHAPAGDKRIIVTRQPVGVSLLITPWNFPAAMATRKLGPALAAGCTTVLKPASETPLTALAVADILHRAGCPKGVVNCILPVPTGPSIARLLADPRVRNVSFTGSTEVGKGLLKACADRVLRTSMELGGNAPFVVLDDADVDAAVQGAMIAKMRNGGAACTAANRFYVARAAVEAFTAKLATAFEALVMGPGVGAGCQLGASVSVKERDKIASLVRLGIEHGGTVVTGGEVPQGPGAFYPATVMRVDSGNPLLTHEIFGPVAPIVMVESDEEAVALANDTAYGLISYVYGGDLRRTLRVAEALESGMVAVNRGVISDPAAPFGGVKESGLGREGGFDGIHEFLESKYIGVEI